MAPKVLAALLASIMLVTGSATPATVMANSDVRHGNVVVEVNDATGAVFENAPPPSPECSAAEAQYCNRQQRLGKAKCIGEPSIDIDKSLEIYRVYSLPRALSHT